MQAVQLIAGRKLSELAELMAIDIPENLLRNKGWVGQLIEKLLGASAGNKPEPDFPNLGIELKTLPIDRHGNPCESTYVSVVPLAHTEGLNWQNSTVKAKLNHVLWVPIEADKSIPIGQRKVGMGILWKADPEIERSLANDYNEFMDRISLGEVESITANQGNILQIRPKAANSSVLTEGIGDHGQKIRTLPRGFYLRPAFTTQIITKWRKNL